MNLINQQQLSLQANPVKRRKLLLHIQNVASTETRRSSKRILNAKAVKELAECVVLVINSSEKMAEQMTQELELAIPGCAIMYAATISRARWLLRRRRFELIVTPAALSDGSISILQETLSQIDNPPDLVVVGDIKMQSKELLKNTSYEFKALRRVGTQRKPLQHQTNGKTMLNSSIKSLGADIRNDLNNPLQEIVAMVFVAQMGSAISPHIHQALDAIDRAAKNMASVVKGIEEKIVKAVVAP